jgi:Glyoxalase-like domain
MNVRWLTAVLNRPASQSGACSRFWSEVTGTAVPAAPEHAAPEHAAREQDGQRVPFAPADADVYLALQRVRDGDSGCHLELHVDQPDSDRLQDAAAEAVVRGAVVAQAQVVDGQTTRVTLASPAGFTFCLVPWWGEARIPGPVTVPGAGAGASRVDQLCLDIPPDRYDSEGAFWSDLTGWPLLEARSREFRRLAVPDELPLKMLLQRLDDVRPGQRAVAHLDVAAGHARSALAAHQEARGAHRAGTFEHWIAMTDPAGQPYCLTMRQPT